MTRKYHLQDTKHYGPTCQSGRSGAALRGEHITLSYSEFSTTAAAFRCDRCSNSKLFSFLERRAADQWVPVADQDAWKAADDALIATRRAVSA